jgi:hypothetical protein
LENGLGLHFLLMRAICSDEMLDILNEYDCCDAGEGMLKPACDAAAPPPPAAAPAGGGGAKEVPYAMPGA